MASFLMLSGCFGGAVHLNEYESRRVIRLLDDIEPRDTRLLHAVARVLEAGVAKRLDKLGLHVNMNMDDQHLGKRRRCYVRPQPGPLQGAVDPQFRQLLLDAVLSQPRP